MKVSILRPARPGWTPEEGPFYRMGRQTVTVPGYQTIRQWVLVACTKEGWITGAAKVPNMPLDIIGEGHTANQPAMEQNLVQNTCFVVWDTIEA